MKDTNYKIGCLICKKPWNPDDFISTRSKICNSCMTLKYKNRLIHEELIFKKTDKTKRCLECNKVKPLSKFRFLYRKEGIQDCICKKCRSKKLNTREKRIPFTEAIPYLKILPSIFTVIDYAKVMNVTGKYASGRILVFEKYDIVRRISHGLWEKTENCETNCRIFENIYKDKKQKKVDNLIIKEKKQ